MHFRIVIIKVTDYGPDNLVLELQDQLITPTNLFGMGIPSVGGAGVYPCLRAYTLHFKY